MIYDWSLLVWVPLGVLAVTVIAGVVGDVLLFQADPDAAPEKKAAEGPKKAPLPAP